MSTAGEDRKVAKLLSDFKTDNLKKLLTEMRKTFGLYKTFNDAKNFFRKIKN